MGKIITDDDPSRNFTLFQEIIAAMSLTIDLAEKQKLYHGHNLAKLAYHLAVKQDFSLPRLKSIIYASLLHDVGQINISDSIINKKGPLTNKECLQLWHHPVEGQEIINKIPNFKNVAAVIRWHHEWWDGTGYPDRLSWKQIPLESQLIRICDSLISLLADRPFRAAFTLEDAIKELKNYSGIEFNSDLVDSMEEAFKAGEIENLFSSTLDRVCPHLMIPLPEEKNISAKTINYLIEIFSQLIDSKHNYSHGHSWRVMEIATEIAQEMGLPEEEIEKCRIAALLHDAGKVAISDLIIDKIGKLSDEEYGMMKFHPEYSQQIISTIEGIGDIAEICCYHHEHYDGTGYPDELAGEDIPLIARILAVADSYAAMTRDRPYRERVRDDNALEEIINQSGKQFDPQIVDVFVKNQQKRLKVHLWSTEDFSTNSRIYQELVSALSLSIDMSEKQRFGHGHLVAKVGMSLAASCRLSYERIKSIIFASLLHDIGQVNVPDAILQKTTNLNQEELFRLWQHPVAGQELCEQIPLSGNAPIIIRWHHEWWDGTGYPDRLVGSQIPLESQIIRLSDTFVSMLAERPYRPAFTIQQALDQIIKSSCTEFNPVLVKHILDCYASGELESIIHDKIEFSEYFLPSGIADVTKEINEISHMFAKMVDLKHEHFEGHCVRVAELSVDLGREIGLDEKDLETCRLASLFHDIGKVGISSLIVEKAEQLSNEEHSIIKFHPEYSHQIISIITGMSEIAEICCHHHEGYDGTGYPDQLKGEEIPIIARIIAVANTFDAMLRERPHREKISSEEALNKIAYLSGRQFDPNIVRFFIRYQNRKALKTIVQRSKK